MYNVVDATSTEWDRGMRTFMRVLSSALERCSARRSAFAAAASACRSFCTSFGSFRTCQFVGIHQNTS